MFLSSSFIIVKINSTLAIVKFLNNSYFKKEKAGLEDDDFSFYSINFFDDEKTKGEIHWSESFNFGKMNLINFVRMDNNFILFTSSVQNYKVLNYVLEELLGNNFELELVKIPLKYKLENHEIEEIVSIEEQNIFGISAILSLNGKYSLLKIYTNGLITYSMTNDYGIVKKYIEIALVMINSIRCSGET